MSEPFKTYECRYYHDGKWWALTIAARDDADAEARVRKLGNLQLSGEIVMNFPAETPTWFVRFIVWWKNLWAGS